MVFKNPSHHSNSLEHPSFNESGQEEVLKKEQTKPELMDESKNEEPLPVEDTTEKDEARIGEIEKEIEKSDNKYNNPENNPANWSAVKRNRMDIKRINALKRAAGEPVTQPKKDSLWSGVKSFFGGKSE